MNMRLSKQLGIYFLVMAGFSFYIRAYLQHPLWNVLAFAGLGFFALGKKEEACMHE